MDMRIVGANIKQWRLERGLGLNELARMAGMNKGNLSRLEAGKGSSSLDTLASIAAALKVPMSHLVKEPSNVGETMDLSLRKVRVLDWTQVGAWSGTLPQSRGDHTEEYVLIATTASSEAFAISVRGDSMEPTFRPGDVILVDPLRRPHPGAFVVARDATGEATFRQYREMGRDDRGTMLYELAPVNPNYAPRRSAQEELVVVGTVVKLMRDIL